nr:retrovirus-related Pol polyprotein from transposon TNT 1-94 [Tanacetum cinerariifolium]
MGTCRETLDEGEEGALHLGLERTRVYSDLSPEEKERVDKIEDRGTIQWEHVQLVMEDLRTELGMQIQVKQGRLSATNATENRAALDEEQLLFLAGGHDNVVDDNVDEQLVQDLAHNVDNVFQADECDAFYSDFDEAPTTQTMFMANLSSADPVYNEVGLSYDSNILSETAQGVSVKTHTKVVDASLTAELAIYREQVKLGLEIVKPNHARVLFHDSEDTLEIAETARKEMNEKMKDLECVKRKVKIAPYDYSKENYLATSTPQKQLTLEQIFWSKDLIKMKAKALKEQTLALRPIKSLTVNNREVHLDYLKHLKKSVATLHEIVKEARVVRPFDRSLTFACHYTKHSQELLEHVIALARKTSTNKTTSMLLAL